MPDGRGNTIPKVFYGLAIHQKQLLKDPKSKKFIVFALFLDTCDKH